MPVGSIIDRVNSALLCAAFVGEIAFVEEWIATGENIISPATVQFAQLQPRQQYIARCATSLGNARMARLSTPLARVEVVLPILKELVNDLLLFNDEAFADFNQNILVDLAQIIFNLETTERECKEYFQV